MEKSIAKLRSEAFAAEVFYERYLKKLREKPLKDACRAAFLASSMLSKSSRYKFTDLYLCYCPTSLRDFR